MLECISVKICQDKKFNTQETILTEKQYKVIKSPMSTKQNKSERIKQKINQHKKTLSKRKKTLQKVLQNTAILKKWKKWFKKMKQISLFHSWSKQQVFNHSKNETLNMWDVIAVKKWLKSILKDEKKTAAERLYKIKI